MPCSNPISGERLRATGIPSYYGISEVCMYAYYIVYTLRSIQYQGFTYFEVRVFIAFTHTEDCFLQGLARHGMGPPLPCSQLRCSVFSILYTAHNTLHTTHKLSSGCAGGINIYIAPWYYCILGTIYIVCQVHRGIVDPSRRWVGPSAL